MMANRNVLFSRIKASTKLMMLRSKQISSVVVFGLPVLLWLMRRDRGTIYFLPHVGLGDYCIALGYLKSYKERHSIQHVTLIVPGSRIEVSGFYPYWDEILVLPKPLYLGIAYLGSIPGGMAILKKFPRIVNITYTLYSSKQLLEEHPKAKADDLVKIILDLPDEDIRLSPIIPPMDVSAIINNYGFIRGKTVLLNPFTGGCAVKELDTSFYERLVVRLKAEGFMAFTILGSNKQKPICGTLGIVASLSEAWYLSRWCGWLIGTRSGFFDFVQPCGCNMIVIDDGTYKQRDVFLLPQMKNPLVREYIWNPATEERLICNILSDLSMFKDNNICLGENSMVLRQEIADMEG